jgi:D-sedoheptulose 7-phosphate isomerase
MTETLRPAPAATGGDLAFLRERMRVREALGRAYVAANAAAMARCAAEMADRFLSGATLFIAGSGVHATDAQHNAVEYLHPALPGCRALPAVSLDERGFAEQLRALGRRGDIALGFTALPASIAIERVIDAASSLDMQTVLLSYGGAGAAAMPPAGHAFHVADGDPHVAQELHLATYHVLWELVHIVLNHRGIAEPVP